ncbi:MAG TPA: serine/threonine-protein kinase [Sandaracinaceae bacterium LLY-WYZ-13_1]|nr:serine/threonine-protein kinase [Sandaracinaceae bacterium LLY-WYZ-13_1]
MSTSTKPPFDPAALPPGTRIADKYELGPPLGWGKHSVVYEATHRLLQRKAAVKILAETDEQTERRFAREAKLAGSLSHANIVDVYEVGRLPSGHAFLAMEHLAGETLEARFQRQGPFSIGEAMRIGQELLHGLMAAHEQSIVHRDLRPENLFLAQIRGEEVLKILDFGISRRFGDAADSVLTTPGTLLGEAAYLAPEQLYEDGVVDHRTDLYATGVLLYRLLTGRLPFEAKASQLLIQIVEKDPPPPSQHRAELPPDVDKVILSALAKRQDQRFRDAEAMAEALRLTSLFSDYVTQ